MNVSHRIITNSMLETDLMAAQVLESGTAGLTAVALDLLQARRDAGQDWAAWREHLRQRVLELAVAVRFGEPDLFARRIVWLRRAARARGLDEDGIALALESLCETVRDELDQKLLESVQPALDLALKELKSEIAPEAAALRADEPAGRLGLQFIAACLEAQPDQARDLIVRALDSGVSPRDVSCKVLVPVQKEIGQLWLAGDIGVAEQHLVTETTLRVMAMISERFRPDFRPGESLLAATVAGDAHVFGLRVAADLFVLAGWRCLFLGADVPAGDLTRAAADYAVDLLVLTASMPTHLSQLGDAIRQIRRHAPDTKILVAGVAFDGLPNVWQRLGADGFAEGIDVVVERGTGLI